MSAADSPKAANDGLTDAIGGWSRRISVPPAAVALFPTDRFGTKVVVEIGADGVPSAPRGAECLLPETGR